MTEVHDTTPPPLDARDGARDKRLSAEDGDRSRRDRSFYAPGAMGRAAHPSCDVQSQAVHQTGEVRQNQPGDGLISVAHPISILVVNDQPRDLIALEAALGSVECNLVTANSGHDALQCLLAQDFAVIILDIEMPIIDGFETARLIRERDRSRSTPIIFLTAYDPDGLRVPDGYRLGAVDYIHTPIDTFVLHSKVTAFVEVFREALAKEERAAESNQIGADELRHVSGRLASFKGAGGFRTSQV
jgi:CheY-like chemotaxis protein